MSVEPNTYSGIGYVPPRGKRGILTDTTGNTLNVGDSTTGSSKKRKQSSLVVEDLLEDPFVTLPSSPSGEVKKLTPILLLPRSHLPLSFLDPTNVSTAVPTERLLSAHIRAFENQVPESPHHTLVMVAELEPEGSLYAVERVRCGLYALCRLGDWVNMEELRAAALAVRYFAPPRLDKPLNVMGPKSWWECAAISSFDAHEGPRIKRSKANTSGIFQLKMRSSRSQNSPEPSQCRKGAKIPGPATVTAAPELLISGSGPCEQQRGIELSAEELLETVRCQYLEALYLSKTSLAYFVKGPLSRVRANFKTEQKSPMATSELAEFLRSSVLSLAVFDKKYRESVPQVIQSLPPGNVSNDEENTGLLGANKRKNKKNKKRLGKDGLYATEDDYIRQWWRFRELDSYTAALNEDRAEEAKRLILDLRTRETQMQLVLVLEVMALEASLAEAIDHGLPFEQTTHVGYDEVPPAKKRRPKIRQDLNLLLELLIDRLTIWQSVSLPEEISRPSTSTGTNDTRNHVRMGHTGVPSATHENNEGLRDFCVEVIGPFYAARLPETCSTVNQRLGGVKVPSPVRPPLRKSASTSQGQLRPGTAIDRSSTLRPGKTMERNATLKKPLSQRQQPPSLLHSATAPALPGLKREPSEVSLSDIPFKRPSVEKSKRYSQREVDLSAISNATEAKLRRKASVEEELRGAIATLKKPNRTLAVKELIESFDQRVPGAGASSRKPKNPIRNPFGQGVQVMATPKGNRRKNVFNSAPLVAREPSPEIREAPRTVPSVELHIPSSVTRPTTMRRVGSSEFRVPQNPYPVRQTLLSTVMQTPTRGPFKSIDALAKTQPEQEEDELGKEMSPRPPMSKPFQTPNKASKREPRSSLSFTGAASSVQPQEISPEPIRTLALESSPATGVAATPLKEVRNSSSNSGVVGRYQRTFRDSPTVERSKTIYDALGWEDDADDLL